MKPSNLLRSVPEAEPHERHADAPQSSGGAPAIDRGVPVRLVREGDVPTPPEPATPTGLREFLTRLKAAGLSAEALTRALGLPPAVIANLVDSRTPPRWFLLALGGVAAARGIPAAELEWLRAAADRAE